MPGKKFETMITDMMYDRTEPATRRRLWTMWKESHDWHGKYIEQKFSQAFDNLKESDVFHWNLDDDGVESYTLL